MADQQKIKQLEEKVKQLEKILLAKEKICQVLTKRVVRSVDSVGGAYSIFERNILLQNLIDQRSRELEEINKKLVQEISERKQAEEGLRQSEAMLSSVFKAAPIGLCIMKNRIFQSVNKAYFENLGYTENEIIGHTPRPLYVDEKEYERVGRELFINLVQHGLAAVQTIHRRKNGEIRNIILTATPLNLDDQFFEMALVTVEDVTERKKLEEKLNRAEKMEALGTLAGGVAHDLNNVLGVLVGYAELMKEHVTKDSILSKFADNMLQSGVRATAIIQDMLTMARRGVAVSEIVNLNDLVTGYLKAPEFENLKTYCPNVQISTELENNLLNIKGSPVHLAKSIMNLVSNAAESISDQGNILIKTENRYLDQPIQGYDTMQEGDYVVFIISDTGSGISAKDINKIFEPFYTKKVMGRSGTGLGLAVVWGTVKDHNGYIDVQSEESKGTTFTLYFPVTREEPAKPERTISYLANMGNGESILVVDDVKEQRQMAMIMLEKLGYEVHSVASGEDAIEYLKNKKADLIILDMIMVPGIDGFETYLRILDVNPKQKAIIVSGYTETDRVKKVQEMGAGEFIRKPYTLAKIGLAVKKELNRKLI
ncbi:MAG: ATP-binding protein [Smithella sp.]